ncbi:hypothetical protein ACU61A_05195 [Pseudonocardia sichuanensis]|uniref:Uncharacterized protein n=1 Tax=Pseudonocardia kunmingensis TaxID=630975 RepID=A0A543E0K7_9PSEU|nr:hypothetical protein [Pseudonocardia kunmingensis]TQM15133.1 hypothetical protein FB558_1915 [Pseudonocardia kunmingensis]
MPNDDTGPEGRTDRPAPGSEGTTESTLRDATLTGTGEDPEPPAEPQGAAFPRHGDGSDDETR